MTASEDKPQPPSQQEGGGEVDLAQAYRDLARGEQAASAMEANLTNLEDKLDAILAAVEGAEGKLEESQREKGEGAKGSTEDKGKGS